MRGISVDWVRIGGRVALGGVLALGPTAVHALVVPADREHGTAQRAEDEEGRSPRVPAPPRRSAKLTRLRIEDLVEVKVTTVSRQAQPQADAPAPVYVISGEDIQRLGFRRIPEALRLAPGVHVARIDANKWAVGVRGFSDRLSRSLLVLMDGRSVYSPLFAGVYWEVQDTFLDDIDRIEVIRGPGGTQWGANAVNGVVNVITKDARETQGLRVSVGGGNEEQGFGGLRYGGRVGDDLHYRVYAKAFHRDGGAPVSGDAYDDDWSMAQGGFRADWETTPRDSVTVQGDVYDGAAGQRLNLVSYAPPFSTRVEEDADLSGGNLLGRWERILSHTSDLQIQLYYDHTFRREPHFREQRDTFDVDSQHSFRLPWRQQILWGLGYRLTTDDTGGIPTVRFVPASETNHLFSAFLDDSIDLIDDMLTLSLGTKVEHNDYSGFEVQPTGRVLWSPLSGQTVWLSVSRAVRTPSRVEDDLILSTPPVDVDPTDPGRCAAADGRCTFPSAIGDGGFDSEKLLAYQLGHRVQLFERFSLDTALFYQEYDDLLSLETGSPFAENDPPPPHRILPLLIRNRMQGDAYGVEMVVDAILTDRFRAQLGYSFLELDLEPEPGSRDSTQEAVEDRSPQNKVTVRLMANPREDVDLDALFRYVDGLPGQGIGGYVALDLRAARRFDNGLEIAVVGQNLLEDEHREFAGGTHVERGGYVQIRWRR